MAVWVKEYASGATAAGFPSTAAAWVQCIGAGTVVLTNEDGSTFTKHATGGEVYAGAFVALVSTSCSYIVIGNGSPPGVVPNAFTPAAAGVTITDAGGFTAAADVEAALAELYQGAKTSQGVIPVPLGGGMLAAGTPMAAWANNAGATAPGCTLTDSKATGLRWNNWATQVAVWLPPVALPLDLDTSAPIVVNVLASKIGATVGDASTFTISAFAQTVGALHDAGSDLGGTSSALTGNATSKTVQRATLSIATPPTPPAVLSMSIKPTDGTLGTDDLEVCGVYITYKRKILAS